MCENRWLFVFRLVTFVIGSGCLPQNCGNVVTCQCNLTFCECRWGCRDTQMVGTIWFGLFALRGGGAKTVLNCPYAFVPSCLSEMGEILTLYAQWQKGEKA